MNKDYTTAPTKTREEWVGLFTEAGHPYPERLVAWAFERENRHSAYTIDVELYQQYESVQRVLDRAELEERMAAILVKRKPLWDRNRGQDDLMSDDIDVLRTMAAYFKDKWNITKVELVDANRIVDSFVDSQTALTRANNALAYRTIKRHKAETGYYPCS